MTAHAYTHAPRYNAAAARRITLVLAAAHGRSPESDGPIRVEVDGPRRSAAVLIWETAHATELPVGYFIRTRDGNPRNLHPGNLRACVTSDAMRENKPDAWRRQDETGLWEKLCRDCDRWLLATERYWHVNKHGHQNLPRCRPCHAELMRARRAEETLRAERADSTQSKTGIGARR